MDNKEDLANKLQSDNPHTRYNAAITLGSMGDVRAAPVLREFLSDGDYTLRAQTVKFLGKVGTLDDLDQMIEIVVAEGDYEDRAVAAQGLIGIDSRAAAEKLIPLLGSENAVTRRYAAETLGYLKETLAVSHLIAALQADTAREVRDAAISALAQIGDRAVVPVLIEEVRDNPDSCFHGIFALAELQDKRALPTLLELFEQGVLQDWGALSVFAQALGKMPDPSSTESLVYLIQHVNELVNDPTGQGSAAAVVYRHAIEAAGQIGGDRLVQVLLDELKSPSSGSVINTPTTAEALANIGDVRAVDDLIACLSHDYWNLQVAAAEALGSLGDVRAVEPLINVLVNSDPRELHHVFLARTAAAALEKIGTDEALAAAARWRENQ